MKNDDSVSVRLRLDQECTALDRIEVSLDQPVYDHIEDHLLLVDQAYRIEVRHGLIHRHTAPHVSGADREG